MCIVEERDKYLKHLSSKRPRVSIGIPFFNSEKTLGSAIRSVFAQTYDDWELIMVDDGSTDSSFQIASSVKDSRVKVVSDSKNRGLAYRLNQIVQLSRGEYIARMDADDMMHAERMAIQVNFLDNNCHVDVVDTSMYSIDDENHPRGVRRPRELAVNPRIVLKRGSLNHATILGKASWFRENPYSEAFPRAEDRELWCRTHMCSTFARLQKPLYFYRESGGKMLYSYLQSQASDLRLIGRSGPSLVGWSATLFLQMRVCAKVAVYCTFSLFKANDHLVRRRNISMSESEESEALDAIATILQTKVPGLADIS